MHPSARNQPRLNLPVREGPHPSHRVVATITEPDVWYAITGRNDRAPQWWQIRYSPTVTGWVPQTYVDAHGDLSTVPYATYSEPASPDTGSPRTSPPATTHSAAGVYANLQVNWAGSWQVAKSGTTVTATFGCDRSPVYYYAAEQPEDLFHIPTDFRPVQALTHTVRGARHVRDDGTDHANSTPRPFNLTVDTDGAVRYVDDSKVSVEIGYLRYQTTFSWETATALVVPGPGSAPTLTLQTRVTTGLNLRAGPGTNHAVHLTIPGGTATAFAVLGQTQQGSYTWWLIRYDADTTGWVRGDYVDTAGDTALAPQSWTAGPYLNQQVNWGSRFELQRVEAAVAGLLRSTRSPVQYLARQNPEDILRLAADYRPAQHYTYTVTGAQEVDAQGVLKPGVPPVSFDLTVGTDGAVRYVDNSKVDHLGYVKYTAHVAWTAGSRVTVPGIPTALETEDIEHDEVELDWDAPGDDGGAPVTRYHVEGYADGDWDEEEDTARTRYTMADLEAETPYAWRVRAANSQGRGEPSLAVQVTTPAAPLPLPAAPGGVRATAGAYRVTLHWQLPATGQIEGYRIYRATGAGGSSALHVADTGATLTYWVDRQDVRPETVYRYQIQAFHHQGTGARSATVSVTTATELQLPSAAPRVGMPLVATPAADLMHLHTEGIWRWQYATDAAGPWRELRSAPTGPLYLPRTSDQGLRLRVTVRWNTGAGDVTQTAQAVSAPVQAADVLFTQDSYPWTGQAQGVALGTRLQAAAAAQGTWRWQRGNTPSGPWTDVDSSGLDAANNTYTPQSADVDYSLRAAYTWSAAGTTHTVQAVSAPVRANPLFFRASQARVGTPLHAASVHTFTRRWTINRSWTWQQGPSATGPWSAVPSVGLSTRGTYIYTPQTSDLGLYLRAEKAWIEGTGDDATPRAAQAVIGPVLSRHLPVQTLPAQVGVPLQAALPPALQARRTAHDAWQWQQASEAAGPWSVVDLTRNPDVHPLILPRPDLAGRFLQLTACWREGDILHRTQTTVGPVQAPEVTFNEPFPVVAQAHVATRAPARVTPESAQGTWQWQRAVDSLDTWTDVGTNSATYIPQTTDVDHSLRVTCTWSAAGQTHTVQAVTPPVAAHPAHFRAPAAQVGVPLNVTLTATARSRITRQITPWNWQVSAAPDGPWTAVAATGLSAVGSYLYTPQTTDQGQYLRATLVWVEGENDTALTHTTRVQIGPVQEAAVFFDDVAPTVGTPFAGRRRAHLQGHTVVWSWHRAPDPAGPWTAAASGSYLYTPQSADVAQYLRATYAFTQEDIAYTAHAVVGPVLAAAGP